MNGDRLRIWNESTQYMHFIVRYVPLTSICFFFSFLFSLFSFFLFSFFLCSLRSNKCVFLSLYFILFYFAVLLLVRINLYPFYFSMLKRIKNLKFKILIIILSTSFPSHLRTVLYCIFYFILFYFISDATSLYKKNISNSKTTILFLIDMIWSLVEFKNKTSEYVKKHKMGIWYMVRWANRLD